MSRTSSTFGRQSLMRSSIKLGGDVLGPTSSDDPSFSKSIVKRWGSLNSLGNSTNKMNGHNMESTVSSRLSRIAANDVERVEASYIKNLQQQIYFLELESNYLREQAKKATNNHPTMVSEAENMLMKLKQMQQEIAALHTDVQKKDTLIERANQEKRKVLDKLKELDEAHVQEKRLMIDDIVSRDRTIEDCKSDINRKDIQLGQAHDEMDKSIKILTENELKMKKLEREMEEMASEHKITQDALDAKRAELLECETKLRDIEEKYYANVSSQEEELVEDLRESIKILREKLKKSELMAEQERYVKDKISADSSRLVKENAGLTQKVEELEKQIEREKRLRDKQDSRRSESLSKLIATQEKEKFLQFELEQTKDLLKTERLRNKECMEQIGRKEQLNTSQELSNSTTRARLSEVQHSKETVERENAELRREKMLLTDHVAQLNKQMEALHKETEELKADNLKLNEKLDTINHLKDFEGSLQAQKWEEFSRLADSMKRLSTAMNGSGPSKDNSSHLYLK